MPIPTALSGTPGTGKSAVARRLAPALRAVELEELARQLGLSRGSGRSTSIDLPGLAARLRSGPPPAVDVVVGHLAHLLPVRQAIILRCHPMALERRLARAHRGTARDRHENFVAEAIDLVLLEAVRFRNPVWEIDTTGRGIPAVASAVRRRIRSGGPSSYGSVNWLADPRVTEHLLDEGR